MKTIFANVTARDIREGEPNVCGSCPIAIAIRRATGLHAEVRRCDFTIQPYRDRHPLSASAREFVRAFDYRGPRAVSPAIFPLALHGTPDPEADARHGTLMFWRGGTR